MTHKATAYILLLMLVSYIPISAHSYISCDDSQCAMTDTCNKPRGLIAKVWDYFSRSNEYRSDKKFDISIIGAPRYSSDKKFGIAALAAGIYSTDRSDTTLMKSDISLMGDFSTVGYRKMEFYGNHIFPHDRYRMVYNVTGYIFPTYTWGTGYDMCNNDDNKTDIKRRQVNIKGSFLIHVSSSLFVGPFLSYDYINCDNPENIDILPEFERITNNIGVGITAVYDSRDVITYPHRGVFINFTQCFRPKFIGNSNVFSTTEFNGCIYRPAWKGSVIAGNINGTFNFGTTPWGMLAQLGGSQSMRGYYEGRYRDRHKMEMQLELRQHLWGRNGMVAWIGAGTVFDKFSNINISRILPNCGLGYRWEFKKNVNLRFDCGLGKSGQSGVMFSVNEAF